MITVAGREVKLGDMLYHRGLGAWAKATRYESSGSLEVQVQNLMGNRKILVTNGGLVNSKRQMYWHEPLDLDLPRSDVSAYQRLIDLAQQGGF